MHYRPCSGLVVYKLDLAHGCGNDHHVHIFHSELTLGVRLASYGDILSVDKGIDTEVAAFRIALGVIGEVIAENKVAQREIKLIALAYNDLLAAFSGETCLGVAQPQDGLFFLYIAAPVTGNPSSVTLRYYCAHYKNLFEAKDAFRFINDDHLGTIAEPFIPAFVCAP